MNYDEIKIKYKECQEVMSGYSRTVLQHNRDEETVKKTLIETYNFLKSIAPIFCANCDHKIDYYFRLLAKDSYDIEESAYNFYIMDTDPDFTYVGNGVTRPVTPNPEAILDWIVYTARAGRAEKVFWKDKRTIEHLSFENECISFSREIKQICDDNDIQCEIKRINPGFERTARLYYDMKFHDICIVTLYGERYLVDCTYRQFFLLKANCLERIGIPYVCGVHPGVFMTMSEDRMKVADMVLKRGWMPMTAENIKHYFDGFALSFRNGHFYEKTGDFSYTTPYEPKDYLRFLQGRDTQTRHEGAKVLKMQEQACSYPIRK